MYLLDYVGTFQNLEDVIRKHWTILKEKNAVSYVMGFRTGVVEFREYFEGDYSWYNMSVAFDNSGWGTQFIKLPEIVSPEKPITEDKFRVKYKNINRIMFSKFMNFLGGMICGNCEDERGFTKFGGRRIYKEI